MIPWFFMLLDYLAIDSSIGGKQGKDIWHGA